MGQSSCNKLGLEYYSLVGEFQPNSIMTFDVQCTWVAGEHLAFQGTRT
jgi:hypothetical protein